MNQPVASNSWWKREIFAPEGWRSALFGAPASVMEESVLERSATDKGKYPAELDRLLKMVEKVRRRILLNQFLNSWLVCLSWIFLGLIIAAAFSRTLKYVVMAAAALAAAGIILSFAQRWWKRPSAYFCAREIDRASGLHDRLSTALYFGKTEKLDPMVQMQRRDALSRLPQLDPQGLFPIRMPDFANRTMALALIVVGLFAYRLRYNPPIMALVHSAASSHVEKAVLAPMAGAMKKELLALVNRDDSEVKEAAADAETVPGLPDAKNADDPSQAGDKNGMPPSDMDDDDSQEMTSGEQGDPNDTQAADASQGEGQDASQAADAQNQQSADSKQPASENNDKNAAAQQTGDQPSSSSSMMQALKNMMKNLTSQAAASPSQANAQSSAAGASQQPGASAGQGEAKSDTPKDGNNDEKQPADPSSSKKPGGGAGNGSTPVPKQADKAGLPSAKKMVPDRVDLEADNFREQGRIRTTSAVGTAQLPLRDIKPQPVAAVKGAEQENIPVRYRLYVQRYFEHADKASQ